MRVTLRCPPELRDLLPPPVPAKRGLPEWLKRMPMEAFSEELQMTVRTVKHCPPFLDAMMTGFLLPLACDVRVRAGVLEWDWPAGVTKTGPYSRSPIGFHVPAQAATSPLFEPDQMFVKFNNFWTIELEPGWSLLVTHPVNREDLPFRTLTGLVDADRFVDAAIQFPARWLDPDWEGVLARGTPVAQCIPVPREPLEMTLDVLAGEAAARFAALTSRLGEEAGVYRHEFRVKKG